MADGWISAGKKTPEDFMGMRANTRDFSHEKFTTIKIVEYIGDHATDMKQGDKICSLIKEGFHKSEIVESDFAGVKTILPTFLNNAISALYKDYDSSFLNQNLKIAGLDNEDLCLLKRVTKRAKEYYENSDKVTSTLNDDLAGT